MVLDVPVEPIIQLIQQHGVIAVMLGMVIEEVFVPIPSPVIPMAAGGMIITASTVPEALLEILLIVAIPASIASVVSSYFVYGIAYFGGKPVIERWGRYLDISWEELQRFEDHFDTGNEKYYVALFRAVPVVPLSLVSGAAGLFRMDWKEYGVWSFIGMMPRNFVLAFIGWSVRDQFLAVARQINTVSTAVLVTVVGAAGLYLLYRNVKDWYKILLEKV